MSGHSCPTLFSPNEEALYSSIKLSEYMHFAEFSRNECFDQILHVWPKMTRPHQTPGESALRQRKFTEAEATAATAGKSKRRFRRILSRSSHDVAVTSPAAKTKRAGTSPARN